MEKQVFRQTGETEDTEMQLKHTNAPTATDAFNGSTTSVRERQEPVGQLWGPGEGAKLTSTMLAVSCQLSQRHKGEQCTKRS